MFKKKFRSLAIVALSFLMVVSFGLGISTFDTKYSAQAAETTFENFTAITGGDWSMYSDPSSVTKKINSGDFRFEFSENLTHVSGVKTENIFSNVTSVAFTVKFNDSSTAGRTTTTLKIGETEVEIADIANNSETTITGTTNTPLTGVIDLYFSHTAKGSGSTSRRIDISKIVVTTSDSVSTNYIVNYDLKDGTGSGITTQTSESAGITLHDDIPTKTGYTFAGWSLTDDGDIDDADYSSSEVAAGVTLAESNYTNKSVTLYAVWTANTYSIKFNANGGNGSMDNLAMTYGTAKNLTTNTFTHATLNFAGWATSANGEVVYKDGQSVNNLTATQGGTVNLYAVWANTITASWTKGDGDWTVSDNYNSEVYATNMHNVTTDVVLANSNGIKITAKANKTAYNDLTTDGANRVPTLQASATDAIEIILPEGFNGTITVQASNYNNGNRQISVAGQNSTTFSGTLASPTTLEFTVTSGGTKYINNIGTGTVYIHSITVTGTADEVVTPTTYTVTYDKNTTDTVNGMPSAATGVSAGTYTLSTATPTRTGYTFKGWATSSGSTSTVTSITVDGDETVYAVWEKDEVEEVVKTINSVVAPTGNYSCYQNADVSAAGLPSSVTGNWTGSDGSSGTIQVPVTWALDTSSTGTKTATGTLGDVDGFVLGVATVTASVTINALPANTVTLTFKNGSSTYMTLEVAEGTAPTRPTDPTNNDALWFGGWWTKDGSSWGNGGTNRSGLSAWGYVFDFEKELTQDTTVYALWIDAVNITSFQAYIDNMVQTGIKSPHTKPLWGSEGFKGQWNYIDGVFFNSVVNLYYNTDESETYTYTNWDGDKVTTSKKEYYLHFLTKYVNEYVDDNGNFTKVTSDGQSSSTVSSSTLDFICESKILYDLYVFTGNEKYIKAMEKALSILNGINKVSGSEITIDGKNYYNFSHQNGNGCSNEIWLDGMYMYAPFLTRYLKATNAPSSDYQQLLAQYSYILNKMRDSETGLYYHAYAGVGNTDNTWGSSGDACSEVFWSRGMGWFVTSMIDVIELMPDDVPVAQGIINRIPSNFSTAYGNTIDTSNGKAFLQSMLKDAIDGLLAHQDPNSKMFYQVVDGGITVDGYQNYLESSGSSMFAYTIMKAARLFLNGQNSKDGKSYAVRGQEIFEGIYNHSLNGTSLYDICKMANLTRDTDYGPVYYLNHSDTQITSNDGKGSGPFVMAFVEYNALKNSVTPTQPTTPDITKRRVHVYVGDEVYFVEVTKGGTTSLSAVQAALASAGYIGSIDGLYTDVNCTSQYGYSAVSEDTVVYALESLTKYNVTFNANGDSVSGMPSSGSYNPLPSNTPTRSGYLFKGWATSAGGDVEYAPGARISGDLTLYAVWVASYTVTFDSNGGSSVADATVESGDTVTKPTDPTLSGYIFDGWYSDPDLTLEFNFSTAITANTTLYAKWTKSTTAVATYTFDEGTNAEDWVITYSNSNYKSSFTNAAYNGIPVRNGYMLGFTMASTSGAYIYARTTESYSSVTKVSFDVSSTDKGKTTIAIAYTTDGGENYTTVMNATTTETMGVSSNKEWVNYTYDLSTPVSGQLIFIVSATSSGKYAAIDNVNITYRTSDEEPEPETYSVTYEDGVDGENISMPSNSNKFEQGATFTISGATPSRSGYTFTGWSTTSGAFDSLKQPNESFAMPASNVTLTANWTINKYTLTYVYGNGTANKESSVDYNSSITLESEPSRDGYTFGGWSDGSNTYQAGATFTMPASAVTLTAVWAEIGKFTVTFDSNGGSAVVNQTITNGQTANEPEKPTKTGYTFAGWFNGDVEFSFDDPITNNITLTAKWTINSYNISWNLDSGSISSGSQPTSANYDATVTLPTATKDGYTFAGWTSSAFNGTKNAGDTFTMPAGDVTITATWTKIPTYNITFNVNYPDNVSSGVSGMPENVTGTTNTSVTPSSPSLDGYTFLGWSENASATSATYAPGASIDITNNPVLYAIWQVEGAGNTVTVNYNFDELQDSNKGYNLNNGGNVIVDGNTYTGDANAYTYTKVATNGVLLSSSEVSRVNYNLVGWATTQYGAKVYEAGGTYTGNDAEITLYPVWEISGNTDNRTTTTVDGEIETHVWSAYVVNGAYDANNAESFYYMGTANGAYKNIRWTDLYKNNVADGVYTISGGGVNDNYSIKVDANSGASVDADHRMVSEPLIKIDKETSSTTYSPISIVVNNGYTASIKVYAVTYNGASEVSILASDKSTSKGAVSVSNKYGNTDFTSDSLHETVNDFVGGINPNILSVNGLSTGTYYIANTGSNHIYITGIEISLTPAVPEYEVNFYTNASESDETIFDTVLTFGGTLILPTEDPSRVGYAFDGWYTARSGGEKVTAGATITENTNYYAHWTELPKYSVNFEESYPDGLASGIKNMPSDIVDTTETSITPSSPSLAGYTFKGWSTISGATSAMYAPGASIDITGSPTLYPVWAEATEENFIIYKDGVRGTIPNDYGITYELKGGSDSSYTFTIDGGESISATVYKSGGSSPSSSRYMSITVPSDVASSFKVKLIAGANNGNDYSFWLSDKGPSKTLGENEEVFLLGTGNTNYKTGISASFPTAGEDGKDITYYINFSESSRIYEISLELTKEINTNVERTISFTSDDNDVRPFEDVVPDQKVTNGESFSLVGFVPTTSAIGYVFSHWEDSLGNIYTTEIESVLRDMTLIAKWYTIVDSADTPESTRGRVPLADAKVNGLYLPNSTTVNLVNGSTVSWAVDWDYASATYSTEINGDYTAKDISNYVNIDVAGFYKVTGTITVPSGYLYKIGEIETSTITVESIVEVYVIGAQVMAGAGYMSDGRTAWNSGLTLTNDRYTLSENGEVSIVVDADNIGEIANDGIINLKGETFSNSNYKDNAPIEIDLPSNYSMLLVVIKVTNATKENVSLWTEDGRSVPLIQTVGSVYTNLTISTTDNYTNKLYLFSSGNNTELHSIVVNAQYEDQSVNIQTDTHKLSYFAVVNDDKSFGEPIEEAYNYLDNAKVIVKPQTEHLDLPDHYLFSRWATATSGTASYYNPGDVLTITSETNNLYVIMEEEPKITITFDVNAPAGMTSDQISQIFGQFTLEYKIYSGESLSEIPDLSSIKPVVNGYTYEFDGWSPNVTLSTTFTKDTVITANWYTATLPVIVKDLEKTVQEGTTQADIINSLPTEFTVSDTNGNETDDFDSAVIVGDWTVVGAYDGNEAGTYLFRATLDTAPYGTIWYSDWAGVEIGDGTYQRSEDGAYYVYCKVAVVEQDAYETYSAEFTAFAYTGSGDHVLYNNNSNTHDKAWSDYYQVATDDNKVPGTIVARNGEVKIIADDETEVDGNITAALVDTDYHGQTWSMIKGYHQTSLNAPFIYVVVPKGYASVKISVYAVRFRASGNDVTLEVGPLNSSKDNMLVTDHSYTETDNETDFNYFYEFSPSYYIYEYSGDETVFTVRNTHRSTNIYLTGIKVECTMVDTESHVITYHSNDGTDNALTREVVYAENVSGDDVIVEKNFFEREGYEFIGWSRTKGSDSIEQNYQVGKSLELNDNITLYAVWQRARALTYYANDGSTDSFTKYYTNGRGPLSENEFDMTAETREDKVFLSWNTQSNGQGDTYYPGDIFNPNASDNRLVGIIPEGTVLYAQWGSGKTLTAKWDAYSSELQAIDTVYTDCSQTFGNDWTTKYIGKIIAKSGDVLSINASGASAGSNAMSKPMLSLAKGNTISVNVSGITTESALSIRVSAVVASGSSKFTINGTEYSVSRTFDDGSTFTPFVADVAVYATTVSENSTINITTTGNNAIYIVGISASVSNDQFTGNTLTYNNNVEGAEETYDYLVSGSTIIDINHFHRDGYTFAGWAATADGAVAYTYGQELTISEDSTLYAKWTPITYNYEFISNKATHDGGTFNLVDGITKPSEDPILDGYIFMGWYLDNGVFQNQATFDGENKFYPSFEMIDGDTVYLYAYFIEDIHTKKILTPNELQDLEQYIVDIMSNVYREEGSTSGTARVSASALELPANVMVTGEGFGKNLAIDWSLAVNGWTLSSLQSGTQTLTGYIRLDNDDYSSFAFSDGVNDNLQQIGISIELTLKNIIIEFAGNEPLVQKEFYYPVGTKRTAVVSQFEVKGFYFDRNGLRQEWVPTGIVWACANYNSEERGTYTFSTDLYADIGYAFEVTNTEDQIVESKIIQAHAYVELQGEAKAYSGVGFERKGTSDWTNGVTGDFTIDSNGDVGNQLVLTGRSNSYGNENGYLTLDAGENALKISIPSGTEEVRISYVGGVRASENVSTFSIVDTNGNVLYETANLGAYQSATLASFTINVNSDNNLSSLTELYVKVNGDEILLSQFLVMSTPVITMGENVVKLRFIYGDAEQYYAISGGDGTSESATEYVKGAKVILPDFAQSGLTGAPVSANIEFAGWSTDRYAQVASHMAGSLYDLDTYTDINDDRVVTLYAVFSIGYFTLTFDSGYGSTVEYKIPKDKMVSEVITIRGSGREQALKDLELSRVGYNFVEWYSNGEVFSSNTVLNSHVTVTATWTPKTYTINFKNGNEIITTDMVTYTEIFNAPVLDKYPSYIDSTRTFRTWTYNGVDWSFGQESLESSGIILDNDVYQIDLQADFGAKITFITEYEGVVGSAYPIVQDSNVYPIGYRYSLQDRVTGLTGYTFMGWSKTQNSETAEFTTSSVLELTENITLYAVWKANEYRITFVSGLDDIVFTSLTVEGVTLENNSGLFKFNTTLPEITATAQGYVIHSWYYIEDGAQKTWVFDGDNPNKVMSNDITLYARWGVTVNFEKFSTTVNDTTLDDGNGLYNSVIVAIDDVIPFVYTQGTASIGSALHVRPQLPGYSFVNWYIDNQGNELFDINQVFTVDFINKLKATQTDTSVTIYAGFEKVTGNVTISFVDTFDTGIAMPGIIEHANSAYWTVTSECIPVSNDVAKFEGWSLYPDGSGDIFVEGDQIFIEGNTVLYAFWTITITDIVIEEPIVRNDQTIQAQIPYAFDGINGENVFDSVFEIKWKLAEATNADDLNDKEKYDLTMGAHNVKAGSYSVPVQLLLKNGYTWAGDDKLTEEGEYYTTNVTITVLDSTATYFIIKINSIEDTTTVNSDYRLNKVTAEISTDSFATEGIEITLDVSWNSQIDTTVWGAHYVLGSVHCGSYQLKIGVTATVSATIEVTKNGAENPYLYKTYQDGTMPDAPKAPSGFEFLCWTDKGVTAVGQNETAPAGEWTAMYAKLSFTKGASIRLNKDYTGIRFTAHLEFYGSDYVAELMKNKSNVNGAVSVTMNFTYEKDETTYNVGTGQDFMNMTQSTNGDNAVITFSGVISDLVQYDSNGGFVNNDNCDIKFTPIAKVKLNGAEIESLTLKAEFERSASEVAFTFIDDYTEGTYQHSVLLDYTK